MKVKVKLKVKVKGTQCTKLDAQSVEKSTKSLIGERLQTSQRCSKSHGETD